MALGMAKRRHQIGRDVLVYLFPLILFSSTAPDYWRNRSRNRMAIKSPTPGWRCPKRMGGFAASIAMLVITAGCNRVKAQQNRSGDGSSRVTDIAIGSTVKQGQVKRLGINIAGQTYWGSSQM